MTLARRSWKFFASAVCAVFLAAGARAEAALKSPFDAAMSHAFSEFERSSGSEAPADGRVLGGVVPHHDIAVGMMLRFYGGFPREGVRRVFLISPDHFARAKKWAAVCPDDWEAADGVTPGDRSAADALARLGFVEIRTDMFAAEHGVTVHVPLIARFFPGASIVPIALGADMPDTALLSLRAAIKNILREGDAVILSADLSHYAPPDELAARDARAVKILTAMQAGATKSLDMDAQGGAALAVLLLRDMGARRGELLERADTSSVLGKRIESGTGYAAIIYRRIAAPPIRP
jgi:AmmeMemoRadiSam system protein B